MPELIRKYGILAVFLLVILLLLPLRASLWLDETVTYWIIKDGLSEVFERTLNYQGQSPLYYLVIWCSSSLTGVSESALRLPSVVFFLGSVAVLFLLARRLFSSRTAIFAVLIFSCTNEIRIAAASARPYAFSLFFTLLSLLFLLRWIESGRHLDGLGYIAASVLTFYAHYLFAVVFIFHLVLFCLVPAKNLKFKSFLPGFLAAAALCAPGVFQMASLIARRHELSIAPAPSTLSFLGTLFPPYIILVLALSVVLAGLFGRISWERMPSTQTRPMLSSIILYLAPPFLFFLISQITGSSLFLARYFLLYTAGMALVFAAIIGCVKEGQARPVLFLALCGLLLFREIERKWQIEDWRGAVAEVQTLRDAGKIDDLLFFSGLIEAMNPSAAEDPAYESYLEAPLQYYPVSTQPLLLPALLEGSDGEDYVRKRIDPALQGHKSVAILSLQQTLRKGQTVVRTPNIFADVLEKRGFKPVRSREFGLVEVVLAER